MDRFGQDPVGPCDVNCVTMCLTNFDNFLVICLSMFGYVFQGFRVGFYLVVDVVVVVAAIFLSLLLCFLLPGSPCPRHGGGDGRRQLDIVEIGLGSSYLR